MMVVLLKHMRNGNERRGEDKATVHHFSGPDPALIRNVAPDINGNSSTFGFFRLMLIMNYSTLFWQTNCYYQHHTQRGENRIL
jgi:hypothetical protein